jgi:hypothetical protein
MGGPAALVPPTARRARIRRVAGGGVGGAGGAGNGIVLVSSATYIVLACAHILYGFQLWRWRPSPSANAGLAHMKFRCESVVIYPWAKTDAGARSLSFRVGAGAKNAAGDSARLDSRREKNLRSLPMGLKHVRPWRAQTWHLRARRGHAGSDEGRPGSREVPAQAMATDAQAQRPAPLAGSRSPVTTSSRLLPSGGDAKL